MRECEDSMSYLHSKCCQILVVIACLHNFEIRDLPRDQEDNETINHVSVGRNNNFATSDKSVQICYSILLPVLRFKNVISMSFFHRLTSGSLAMKSLDKT